MLPKQNFSEKADVKYIKLASDMKPFCFIQKFIFHEFCSVT